MEPILSISATMKKTDLEFLNTFDIDVFTEYTIMDDTNPELAQDIGICIGWIEIVKTVKISSVQLLDKSMRRRIKYLYEEIVEYA